MTLGWVEGLGGCLQVRCKARVVVSAAVPRRDREATTFQAQLQDEGEGPIGRQAVQAHLDAELQVLEARKSPLPGRNEEQHPLPGVQSSGIHT